MSEETKKLRLEYKEDKATPRVLFWIQELERLVDDAHATIKRLTEERDGKEVECGALRDALRADRARCEQADDYESWLDQIGQMIGCGHADEALVVCVRRYIEAEQEKATTALARVEETKNALKWYANEASAMCAAYEKGNGTVIEAIITELRLDNGRRASAAMTQA